MNYKWIGDECVYKVIVRIYFISIFYLNSFFCDIKIFKRIWLEVMKFFKMFLVN